MATLCGLFQRLLLNDTTWIRTGTGTPEGSVTGAIGDLFLRTNGSVGTVLYVKESGSGNTGWTAMVSAGSSAAAVQATSATLTDANIKALPTTPITVIAAPGSGNRIKLLAATFSLNNTAAAYTNLNATYASLQLETSDGLWLTLPAWRDTGAAAVTNLYDLLANTGSRRFHDFTIPYVEVPTDTALTDGQRGYVSNLANQATANAENKLVRLAMDNNGSGNLTGGNAANVAKVTVLYTIEVLAP